MHLMLSSPGPSSSAVESLRPLGSSFVQTLLWTPLGSALLRAPGPGCFLLVFQPLYPNSPNSHEAPCAPCVLAGVTSPNTASAAFLFCSGTVGPSGPLLSPVLVGIFPLGPFASPASPSLRFSQRTHCFCLCLVPPCFDWPGALLAGAFPPNS